MKQGNSDNEVKMYSDFKSPYAYIAFEANCLMFSESCPTFIAARFMQLA